MIHLLKAPFEKISKPFLDLLIKYRISAFQLTIISFIGTALASILVYCEIWVLGALIFGASSLFDALDGALARKSYTSGPRGSFLDSVTDRFSDSAILFAVILYSFNSGNREIFVLSLLALIFSLVTSYIKAKAEIFVEFGSIGLLQRPERISIIFFMLLFNKYIALGLWILVIGGYITVCQRLFSAFKKL